MWNFSLYTQFKNKGFEFGDTKTKKKYRVAIDDQNKNIVSSMNWKQYLSDFDSRYPDQNLTFVYDQNQSKFLTNEIFPKISNIINDNCLR